MGRRTVKLTRDNLGDLPGPCRCCRLWEFQHHGTGTEANNEWVFAALREWGSCGRVAYIDGQVAGFVLFAPGGYAASSQAAATSRVADDAVLLMAVRVLPTFADGGLGKTLVQAAAGDLARRRDVQAIQAFADAQGAEGTCVIPAPLLASVGFKTEQDHLRYPRLRMDLRSTATWRDGVEEALDRLVGVLAKDRKRQQAPRPAGAGRVSR